MATKKVTELTHADLGKNVELVEPNSDRNTGLLSSLNASIHTNYVSVEIDNAIVRAPLDSVVTFID